MKNFEKKYQVWSKGDTSYPNGAYTFEEFDTLAECIQAHKYDDWYITKRVSLSVTDAEEQVITPTYGRQPTKSDESQPLAGTAGEVDPAEQLAAKYAAGPVASIN